MAADISLWPDGVPCATESDSFQPYLTAFPAVTDTPRGAVLICPGGGYSQRADHEGAPIAEAVNVAGLSAYVLQYRVAPNRHPAPLLDASRALRIIRANAAAWNLAADKIAILGFSAGGHLAGSLSVLHDRFAFADTDDLHRLSNRPDASILCYPVISAGEFTHKGSFRNLLGEQAGPAEHEAFSLEKQINAATPPAFLWHTTGDTAVPPENSMLYAGALQRLKIPYELHIYPGLSHGLGLALKNPHVATWMPLAMEWLKGMGW